MKVLNIGLIGCGQFVRNVYIPILKNNPKYRIHAVMDIAEDEACKMKELTGASYMTTDISKLLKDDAVDAVFVTTRHDSHAKLCVQAADAGKHILCEKPMALNFDDCRKVAEAVKRNNVKYTIGYNRGMAPFIKRSIELLKDLSDKKKMIYHRIQAPFPKEHWTHDPAVGGGRFVGEGCHIFDLFCRIIKAPPVKVYASGGTFLDPDAVKIPDSGVVVITFADGSVAATLVNSAGCADFPKEATEIYCESKAIYINDFKKMEYYGFEGQKRIDIELSSADKGHAAEIDQFADAVISGKKIPNGVVNAARAALISFKVMDSIKHGMPVDIDESEYTLI